MRSASVPPTVRVISAEQRIGRYLLPLAAAIAFLTLMPSGGGASAAPTPFWCLVFGDYGAVDVALNTLLFVPFGLALELMGSSWRRILGIALVSSVCTESLQLTWIPDRDASISDMLTNTAGGVLGALLAIHWQRLIHPDTTLARRILTALVVGWTATRVGTAWLLRGSFPDTNWY